MIKYTIISFLVLLSTLCGAEVFVNATLDSNTILIGQQATITLKVDLSMNDQVYEWPNIGDTIIDKVEVVSLGKIDTLLDISKNEKAYMQKIRITSFDSGFYAIPPFKFSVNNTIEESPPLLFSVLTIPIDTTKAKIYDIKGPITAKFSILDWIWHYKFVLLQGLVLIALIILLIYLLTKKQPTPTNDIVKEPTRPAHLIALEKIDWLVEQKLWQNNKTKEYYSLLSEILRAYLEKRYKILAQEQTTDEIMTSIKYFEIDEISRSKLRQVLMLSDLVKFAKEKPIPNENEMCIKNAIEFINETAPKPQNTEDKV
ncbi:MAG: hypothetical protein MRY83_07190 [Flavobacteriales bacterium]|nr:hypothetical protein [Flavobacteriales bacterium]